MRLGLRSRVALTFGVLSLLVAITVSGATYFLARTYFVSQRENATLTRALVDARAASAGLASGLDPAQVLQEVPSVGTSQSLLFVDGEWYTTGITVSPESLPEDISRVTVESGGAIQSLSLGSDPYFVVSVRLPEGGAYVEVSSLRDLNDTFVVSGWVLAGLALLAFLAGTLIGRYAGGRLLRPLRDLSTSAGRIAKGDLTARVPATGDPDLDPIAESFNEMAEAVQSRIARERRFSANVSHELRSPLTSVLGTAELLERRKGNFTPRDSELVDVLARQVRRLSQMVLDLLEIGRMTGDADLQVETSDIARTCREVLRERGIDEALVIGDEPLVRVDPRRFERIVANLVDNAQRHGGGLTSVLIVEDAGTTRVCVDDAGPGVDPDDVARLFEPFARGTRGGESDGAGLGLALVREQALAMGAGIAVERSPAGGARFVLSLADDL